MGKVRYYEKAAKRYHAENQEAKNARLIFGVLVVGGALWFFRKPIQQGAAKVVSKIRGIRNNNLLNIKHNPTNQWQGMTGVDDKGFVIFADTMQSLRAGFKILAAYRKNGFNTIAKIIQRFAPDADGNDTANYISYVASKTGIPPTRILTESEARPVLAAMVKMETSESIPPAMLEMAFQAART